MYFLVYLYLDCEVSGKQNGGLCVRCVSVNSMPTQQALGSWNFGFSYFHVEFMFPNLSLWAGRPNNTAMATSSAQGLLSKQGYSLKKR